MAKETDADDPVDEDAGTAGTEGEAADHEALERLKLERAGKYLMLAGFLSALVAGAYGLSANDVVVVLLSIGTVLGYAIAG